MNWNKFLGIGLFSLIASIFFNAILFDQRSRILAEINSSDTLVQSISPIPSVETTHPPHRLYIPDLSIDTQIEHVGQDEEGRMATPQNYKNVAWYKFGPEVGEKGNMVIAGHYDDPLGPSVFFRLENIKKGDNIYIIDTSGKASTYIVDSIASYPEKSFPLNQVFGPTTSSRLNLITCDGVFSELESNYLNRLVVSAYLSD